MIKKTALLIIFAAALNGQTVMFAEQPPPPGVFSESHVAAVVAALIAAILLWVLFGYPHWRVWSAHQSGMADLQKARNEQQIQVSAAQGRLDAATLNKQAAVIEAEAVSAQIKEIGTQLTAHDLYLRWQWIKMMDDGSADREIIYVPTEANLPILEAARLKDRS